MDEQTAFEVEGALIDAYGSCLTNAQNGHYSGDRGVASPEEIVMRYKAEVADLDGIKAVIIKANESVIEQKGLYDTVRFAWIISKQRAEQADIILLVSQCLIRGVFVADEWMRATPKNFPEFPYADKNTKRYGFKGHKAKEDLWIKYLGKRLPEKYCKKGAANPVQYTF